MLTSYAVFADTIIVLIILYLGHLPFIRIAFVGGRIHHVGLPVRLSAGLALVVVASYTTAMFALWWSPVLLSLIVALILYLPANLIDKPRISGLRSTIRIRINRRRLLAILPQDIVLLVALSYHMYSAMLIKWPPPGDLIAHGQLAALIGGINHIPYNLEPLSNASSYYPEGFAVLTIGFSRILSLSIGETMLLLGGVITGLLQSLVFSLAYSITKSNKLSIIPFLVTFYIDPSGHLGTFITGFFYNGTYPSLLGLLLVVLFLTILFQVATFDKHILLVQAIISLALLYVYPSFLWMPFVLSLGLFANLKRYSFRLSRSHMIAIMLLFVGSGILFFKQQVAFFALSILSGTVQGGDILKAFRLDQEPYYLITLPLALMFATRQVKAGLWRSAGYAVMLLIAMVPLLSPLQGLVIKVPPLWGLVNVLRLERFIPLATVFTSILSIRLFQGFRIKTLRLITLLILALISLYLMAPSIARTSNFEYPRRAAWYSSNACFQNDYKVSFYLASHASWDDLVLNDMSWSGLFLPAYGLPNVVFHYFPHREGFEVARTLWMQPQNATLVEWFLRKHGVKYIFVSCYPYYLDLWMYGGDSEFKKKPLDAREYIRIFDSYSFLIKLYQAGDSAVYLVEPTHS